jgi:hypothetical protein
MFVHGDYELLLAASCLRFIAQVVAIARLPAARIDALPSLNAIPLAVK